jgi:VWFA-related protein
MARDLTGILTFTLLTFALACVGFSAHARQISAEVDTVSVDFSVTDRTRPVKDLQLSQIRVFEDGREQKIEYFARHSDIPLNVGVLIDSSTSLDQIRRLQADATAAFLETLLRPRDLAFVVRYFSRVETLQLPTQAIEVLRSRLDGMVSGTTNLPVPSSVMSPGRMRVILGPTAPRPREAKLFDAVIDSVNRYLKDEIGRKAIVILALADDANSEASLNQALRALKQANVMAFVVQVEDAPNRLNQFVHCDILHIFSRDKDRRISRLAQETGGRVIKVRGMDRMGSALMEIAEELKNHYSIGYKPLNMEWDGAFRKLKIKVINRNYTVRARDGYYATYR